MKTLIAVAVLTGGLLRAMPAAADVLATSNFDVPPFTAGISVAGQGGSEPGWAAPWQEIGGFSDRGHVVTTPTYEGTGSVQLFADEVYGTSVEHEWANIVPQVEVDAYVYVTPGAGCAARWSTTRVARSTTARRERFRLTVMVRSTFTTQPMAGSSRPALRRRRINGTNTP